MRRREVRLAPLLLLLFGVTAARADLDRPERIDLWRPVAPNTLTPAEREAGWRLLWDGRSGDGWRAAAEDAFPEDGWTIEGDALSIREAGAFEFRAGGDLFSRERFGDFVLDFEFWLAAGANSGVKYRAEPQRQLGFAHSLGCEFQLLDDAAHPDAERGRPGTRRLAGLYDMIPAEGVSFEGVEAWNHGRIHLEKGRLSHYLNGIRVVDVQVGSRAWNEALAGSKFAERAGYCASPRGHIVLQDHGDHVRFRNLRVRPLDPAFPASLEAGPGGS